MMRCIAKALLSTPDRPRPTRKKHAIIRPLLQHSICCNSVGETKNAKQKNGAADVAVGVRMRSAEEIFTHWYWWKRRPVTVRWLLLHFSRENIRNGRRMGAMAGGPATAEDMQMVYILSKHKDYVWQGYKKYMTHVPTSLIQMPFATASSTDGDADGDRNAYASFIQRQWKRIV